MKFLIVLIIIKIEYIFRLLILLQRRKKYKTRAILGYKTLAEGVVKMDAVLQKSMDLNVELSDTTCKNGRAGFPVAIIRANQITSSPVDQIDNKNNNSVLIAGKIHHLYFALLFITSLFLYSHSLKSSCMNEISLDLSTYFFFFYFFNGNLSIMKMTK